MKRAVVWVVAAAVEQPGTAAAAGLGVTLDYLPLLPMPKKNQARRRPARRAP